MRRYAIRIGCILAFLLIPALFGLYWLLETAAGARLAIGTLAGMAGGRVTMHGVEGRLLDHLRLTGVRMAKPTLQVGIRRMELAWDPRQLLRGRLAVSELALFEVDIQDDAPKSSAPPNWKLPQVGGTVRRLSARISQLRLQGVRYRHLAQTPVAVTEFSSSVAFDDGLLSLADLHLVTPEGRVAGEIAAGLWYPSLRVDLAAVPARPFGGMDLISLQARLFAGRGQQRLSGGVALAGRSHGRQRLELTAELGATADAFTLRNLMLSRPGRHGTLTGRGSMSLAAGEPSFSLSLRATDLDLAEELQLPTRLSGALDFRGGLSRFEGSLALANSGPGWQTAALAADYRGGPSGVKLSRITGTLLKGRLNGALDIDWSGGVRIDGALAGRGLDPGRLKAGWQGAVNLDLAGNLELPQQGAIRGAVAGRLLESRLAGRKLQGELLAAFVGESLRVDRLLLRGRGFELSGSGELDRRLNLAARVTDLSGLVPGGAGAFRADGWVRLRDRVLSGGASGSGENLAADGVQAAALQLDASLGEGEGAPVKLDAALGGLRLGRFQAERARLRVQGSAARHSLEAEIDSIGCEAHATVSGGYEGGVWRGELAGLSGRDGVGPWGLAAPAALQGSAAGVRIAPMRVNGAAGERLELSGVLHRRPLAGEFRGAWNGLNLARANGWLDRVALSGETSGELNLRLFPGMRLAVSGHADARGTLEADGRRLDLERAQATLEGGGQGVHAALALSLRGGEGAAQLQFDSPSPAVLALPGEGELMLRWSELNLAQLRPLLPMGLAVEGRLAGQVTGRLSPGDGLELKGTAALSGGHLQGRAEGTELDAALSTAEIAFDWRGARGVAGGLRAGALKLTGQAAANGYYAANGGRIAFDRSTLRLDADRLGTRARLDLVPALGGTLRCTFSSPPNAVLGLPETGELAMEWDGLEPVLLKPWLPGVLDLQGKLAGQAHGTLGRDRRLALSGEADFSQGRVTWPGSPGGAGANLRTAALSFDWRGETLSGALSLALAEYGEARGSFQLPIPARYPVAVDPRGGVRGTLTGRVQERGLFAVFLPGVLQESHGKLDLDLALAGTWGAPNLAGTLRLADGGAYLPVAGIHLSDLQLSARLEGDRISITDLVAVSGGGRLRGSMLVRLQGWQVAGYSGSLTGERFQTVYLPELQLWTSPRLTFAREGGSVTVKGELRVPEMLVSGPPMHAIVTQSSDVILEGALAPPAPASFPLAVQGEMHLVLGDKVQVKASGIDARLGGEMDLVLKGIDKIASSGEIRVVKGQYRAYGVDLDIVRGRLYYVNAPLTLPTLDILALHTVGEVRAGVTVAGYLSAPIVKLYSEPPMADVDILAYIVLGHPLGSGTDQGSMMAMAASSLFSFGQSASLQEQIKARLGLSVLGMETVNPASAGLMGYKEVPVAPAGTAPAKPVVGQSQMTVGKYLTPKLYFSYGRSLVTGGNLFLLRYDLLRHWQLETQSGAESGVDLYYKLEFN